jgi:hypothetical protein
MNLIKITPISDFSKAIVEKHGQEFEILIDKDDRLMLRSMEKTHEYRESVMGRWIGWVKKKEVSYE